MKWLILISSFLVSTIVSAGQVSKSTSSKERWLQDNLDIATIPWEEDDLFNFIEQLGDTPFSKISDNPVVIQKMSRVGTRLLANKELISSIAQAPGVDFLSLMAQATALLSDMEKLRVAKTASEARQIRTRITESLTRLQNNEKLINAARIALIKNGDFLAKVLVEERLISSTLGRKEFIDEVMKYEEGKIVSQVVDIPSALQKTEEAVAEVLANEVLMEKLLQPETSRHFGILAIRFFALLQELGSSQKRVDFERVEKSTAGL